MNKLYILSLIISSLLFYIFINYGGIRNSSNFLNHEINQFFEYKFKFSKIYGKDEETDRIRIFK